MSTRKLGIAERLYTGQTSYDFMKNRRLWFIVSAARQTEPVYVAVRAIVPGEPVAEPCATGSDR